MLLKFLKMVWILKVHKLCAHIMGKQIHYIEFHVLKIQNGIKPC
jgi:hypothetical protein